MTISDRRLDRYRLGELEPEEASELVRELTERGELHRLEALEAEAEAFLEHYPPEPAVRQLRADIRRADREPKPVKRSPSIGFIAFASVACGVMVALFLMYPAQGKRTASMSLSPAEVTPFIAWSDSEIDCVGREECRRAAIGFYRTGRELLNESEADVANPYLGYQQLDRAEQLLERGGIDAPPPEMANLGDLKLQTKVALDRTFNQSRVNFHNYQKRKMYRRMAEELNKVQAHFPDKRNLYHRWAVEKERQMKDDRVYPRIDSPTPQ